ncbi:acyltransferase [Fructilactobacillus frigidiflavus]|uniref:acyltransferase n=1 Tax=Fructilactobacillus frigidiflavus TaxID=3242688 RepID=UPI0037583108
MKKRLTYIDVINIVAIYAVLMLHSSQYQLPNNVVVKNGLIQAIFIPAVYLFFMNSGATLIGYLKKYPTKVFFIKRFKRVLIPLIFWSIAWYLFDTNFYAFPGPIPHPHPSISDFLISFANNNIFNIFWFFYAIMLLYLTTPILAYLADKYQNVLFYIVCLNFLGNYCFNFLVSLTKYAPLMPQTALQVNPFISTFIGFFIMGYLIKVNYFNQRQLTYLKIAGLVSFIVLVLAAVFKLKQDLINSPFLFLYCVGIYIFLKQLTETHQFFTTHQASLAKLSSVSLGIYILHPLFFLWFKLLIPVAPNGFVYIWLMPLVTYLICGTIVYLMKKVKLLKIIMP